MNKTIRFIWAAFTLLLSSWAWAGAATYTVTVDTSSVSGTSGSLDFQFNPGLFGSQSATLQVLNFAGDGTLSGAPILTGHVTGALPGTLSFDNGTGFNDYFGGFVFGNALSFNLTFSGPAVLTPDGVSASGSSFAFSMFSDPAGTVPVLTSDTTNGFAFTVDVNLDGTTTVTNNSAQTLVLATSVPEPTTEILLAAGLVAIAWRRRSQR